MSAGAPSYAQGFSRDLQVIGLQAQNDIENGVILSVSDTPSGHRRIPAVGRQAAGTCPPTHGILQRFALQNDIYSVILRSIATKDPVRQPAVPPERALLRTGFFGLRPQNDRKNGVILSEAKDPVRQPAGYRGTSSYARDSRVTFRLSALRASE